MVDDYSEQTVSILKTDIAGNALAGANLTVTDENGNTIDQWESDEDAKEVTVQPGTYTLTENEAPYGYEVAESITFTVDENGRITVNGEEATEVVMVDDFCKQSVSIKKTDIAGNALAGATLQVTDANGNTIKVWESGDGAEEINVVPGTHTLTEDSAPVGYLLAESITFTVDENGRIYVANEEVTEVVMIDESCSHTNIMKIDAEEVSCTKNGNNEYWFCLSCGKAFTDEACTQETSEAAQTIAAKGHTEVVDEAVAASCVKSGKTAGSHCSECGEVIKKQETIAATGVHKYGSWKVTVKATALKAGSQTRTCKICAKTEKKTIAKLKATITLSKTKVSLKKGKSVTIKVSNLALGDGVKTWTSSNKKIATVNSKGKITAKKKGKATISVTLKSGLKKTVKVTVK